MRLGAYDCILKKGSFAEKIYKKHNAFKDAKKNLISERHRHRFEVNPEFIDELTKSGDLIFSGTSPDNRLMEIVELNKKKHPFFLATQFHPEFLARPLNPHPLFTAFLKACKK